MTNAAPLFRHLYRAQLAGDVVAEASEPFPPATPEKLVSCLWFDQRWRPPVLRTLDDRTFVVHSPGRWNRQAGPDFLQAVIEFDDGKRRRGDVEIHRFASGWTAHRHHLDPRYNQVILHVFLWNDRRATEVRRADGQTVPQVALEAWLPRPLAAYHAEIPLEDYPHKHVPLAGRCYTTLQALACSEVQQFLERAGDIRLQQRQWRWAGRTAEADLGQVMYEAVLRSLGSTGYRQHFQMLARLVSWNELQHCLRRVPVSKRRVATEAVLLGLAGILQQAVATAATMDEETQRYIQELQGYWDRFAVGVRQRAWDHVTWRQPHIRPVNTPERRLAGMAQVLTRYHSTDLVQAGVALCRTFLSQNDVTAARSLCKAMSGLFETPEPSYWTRRAHFGGRQGKAQRLIGTQRALTVVIDAVLPILLLYAQRRGDTVLRHTLLACYQMAPRLPDNALLRYMSRRLLGDDPALLALVTGARHQQGMLQVFYDFCSHDEGDCQGCDFPLMP